SFRRFLMRLLLGHARIGLCGLARRRRFGVLHALKRGLRDGSVGIPLRHRALLNGRAWLGAPALRGLAGGRADLNSSGRRGSREESSEMREQIGANRAREAGSADLDELHEETREVGILARHEMPPPKEPMENSKGRPGRIQGASREKK